jgi:predicted DNA repair protein MutK
MKSLSILGTAAMFLVGGGIVTHGIPWLHHGIEHAAESVKHAGGIGALVAPIIPSLLNGLCGLIAGMIVLLVFTGIRKLREKTADH